MEVYAHSSWILQYRGTDCEEKKQEPRTHEALIGEAQSCNVCKHSRLYDCYTLQSTTCMHACKEIFQVYSCPNKGPLCRFNIQDSRFNNIVSKAELEVFLACAEGDWT
jgi:hypothetical protein